MKKKYMILVDGLLALLGSAINVFAPVMIYAMGLAAHKDFGSVIIALNGISLSWQSFLDGSSKMKREFRNGFPISFWWRDLFFFLQIYLLSPGFYRFLKVP